MNYQHYITTVIFLTQWMCAKCAGSSSGLIGIPTREEQADLLLNVQEVFEQVKLLAKDEGGATDESVVNDVNLMVKRARFTLELLEELTLDRLSCNSNSVCMLESKPIIRQLTKEGTNLLETCVENASRNITKNSNQLTNTIHGATDHGQELLNALGDCSRKYGLAIISCYKKIINTDVVPVKKTLLSAIGEHRSANSRSIDIRNEANSCVDEIVNKYHILIGNELQTALNCK